MKYIIPIANQLSYTGIPRNKELNLTVDNHCNYPSRALVVDWQGNCFVCACEAWLPITVGNISDFTKLSDVWNSDIAKSLQQDIDDKKFTHCAVNRCGILNKNVQMNTHYVSINIDESCNLYCPSCRKGQVLHTEGFLYEQKLKQVEHLVTLLENFDQSCHIVMSGNGDPLASRIMRPLIHAWVPRKNHTIRLFTNGLLLEKQLDGNSIVNQITQYFISIDAGSAEVYEQVRQPGRFDQLIKNLDFLRKTVDSTGAEVLLKFVLQSANFHDMQNFVDLCKKYNFQGVINRLEDWGTWDQYNEHDVIGNTSHPDHATALENLKNIYDLYHDQIQFNSSLIEIANEQHR
jgi:MoaA/NifB/PqqE/SkfB family radical SAM enzyme